MRITDLIPWRRKGDRTKVPIKVRDRSAPMYDQDTDRRPGPLAHWTGLAPFGAFGARSDLFGPRMDMVEDDNGFKVTFEVPGMHEDDIDVSLSGERLTVRGETQEQKQLRSRNSHRHYRARRAFRRSVLIPSQVDAERAEASLRRGVLTINLPKVTSGRTRKRITVRRG